MQTQDQNREPSPIRSTTNRPERPERPERHAEEQVAMLQTRLALARWTRGGDIPHVHASTRAAPLRAAWYAQARRQFQDWLEAGGFRAE